MEQKYIDRLFNSLIYNPVTHCWEWTGVLRRGYGRITINYKMQSVHRVIYEYCYGPIFKEKPCILHRCDNPKCCNPLHLYAGTHQDNTDDMLKRNRCKTGQGEKNHSVKLTEEQVLEIRASKELLRILAKRYNMSITTIHEIKTRKTWKHI